MFQRVIALVLSLAFVTTASASTIGPEAVRSAVKEFDFAVNVQWDQKDPAFYKAQVEKFKGKISALQAKGMTMAEIIDATSSTVKNAKLAAEMKEALTVIEAGNMSIEESQQFVMQAARNSQNRGASWSSDVYMWIGPVIGLAIIIALLAGGSSDGDTTGDNTGLNCGNYYNCYWGYDFYNSYTYQCGYVWSCSL